MDDGIDSSMDLDRYVNKKEWASAGDGEVLGEERGKGVQKIHKIVSMLAR